MRSTGQLLGRPSLPGRQLGAGAGDDEVHVPIRALAERSPGVEHNIETLAAIAERADEQCQRPIARESEFTAGVVALRSVDCPESRRIDTVVHDPRPRTIDALDIRHIVGRALAVADDHAGVCERAALFANVATIL